MRLILTKTNARATVHRPGYMDYIGVLQLRRRRQTGRRAALPADTSGLHPPPVGHPAGARTRHEYVMRQSGDRPTSHSGKALRHILETLPRDELFQSNEAEGELFRTGMGILGLQERLRSRLFLRRDRYGRYFGAGYVPRDR